MQSHYATLYLLHPAHFATDNNIESLIVTEHKIGGVSGCAVGEKWLDEYTDISALYNHFGPPFQFFFCLNHRCWNILYFLFCVSVCVYVSLVRYQKWHKSQWIKWQKKIKPKLATRINFQVLSFPWCYREVVVLYSNLSVEMELLLLLSE